MPNVPKMSRRKSDSGVDVFSVELSEEITLEDLDQADQLLIASVKHTVDNNTSGLRYKLTTSLSDTELTRAYLASQLRVLHGRLLQEGVPKERAGRVYLFLRDFPSTQHVRLFGIGVADPSLRDDFLHHTTLLPSAAGNQCFRMILLPGLSNIHERCL